MTIYDKGVWIATRKELVFQWASYCSFPFILAQKITGAASSSSTTLWLQPGFCGKFATELETVFQFTGPSVP